MPMDDWQRNSNFFAAQYIGAALLVREFDPNVVTEGTTGKGNSGRRIQGPFQLISNRKEQKMKFSQILITAILLTGIAGAEEKGSGVSPAFL